MRTFLSVIFLVIVLSSPVLADSVSQPPGEVREWSVTATVTSQNVKFSGYTGTTINVINDGAETVYISREATVSGTPTNGDSYFSVLTGESRSLDIQFNQFSYIAAANTSAIRITVTSQN